MEEVDVTRTLEGESSLDNSRRGMAGKPTQDSARRAEWTEQLFLEGVAGDKTGTQMGQSVRTSGSQAQSLFFTPGTQVFEEGDNR